MRIVVEELCYGRHAEPFIKGLQPYAHQLNTLKLVRQAISEQQTICIENTSVTGSGKTLANFAASILDGARTIGVYPTNELLYDQYGAIEKHLAYDDILRLDSRSMDEITDVMTHMRSHAEALAWATGEAAPAALLTNPDVLYFAMYDLYGQMFSIFHRSYGAYIFQHILSNYPIIAFDEFHLYSTKQIADAAFIMGTIKALAPRVPHIFIFSSATPQPLFKHYVQRLGMDVNVVTDTSIDSGSVVCEQIEINILPANLLRWQGGDAIRDALPGILAWAVDFTSPAKGVFIVDSVYEAKRIAEDLRKLYPMSDIGEVHGYMDPQARSGALQCRFSVGTTTIDVGVDLTGNKSKNFLVCEARSAAQAIQRIGRLGRGGRAHLQIDIPNRAWLAVPDYVYQYILNRVPDGSPMKRNELNELLNKAYLGHENFLKYTVKYSPQEATAACERIQQQFHKDTEKPAIESLHQLVPTLYAKQPPMNQEEAEKSYKGYLGNQLRTWRRFGTKIQGVYEKARNKHYLSDLESFRGGMESDFTVIIYDELDKLLGLKPVKTYNLPFVLRRTRCEELSRQSFIELVKQNYPAQAEEWVTNLEHPRKPLGYIHVKELIDGKANEVYFELDKAQIEGRFQQVIRLQGITIDGGNARLLTSKESINGRLNKSSLNCWVSERNSFRLSEGYNLPPLFAIYELHAINLGGKSDEWSIAFGLDAFFLSCIARNFRLPAARSDNTAIII